MVVTSVSTVTPTATTNAYVWTIWTTGTSSASTSTIIYEGTDTSTSAIWGAWNVTAASSTATVLATTWTVWGDEYVRLDDERGAREAVRLQNQRTQPSAEQLERWRRQEEEACKKAAEATQRLLDARRRARELLVACLSPRQREDLDKKKCFYLECHSPDGSKRRYRIDEGTHGNVKLLDDKDRVVGSYCVQPNGVPTEDAMLAQKLWLETNEDEFKRKANFRRWAS